MKNTPFIYLTIITLLSSCCSFGEYSNYSYSSEDEFFKIYTKEEIDLSVQLYSEDNTKSIFDELNPIKIYGDKAHLCVVTSIRGEFEYGYYFIHTCSSYIPVSNSEWTFTHLDNGQIKYKRKL